MTMECKGVDRVIEAAGGVNQLSVDLGVSHQVIYQWRKRGWVPPARAIEIENRYDVPRTEVLNPRILHLVGMKTDADLD